MGRTRRTWFSEGWGCFWFVMGITASQLLCRPDLPRRDHPAVRSETGGRGWEAQPGLSPQCRLDGTCFSGLTDVLGRASPGQMQQVSGVLASVRGRGSGVTPRGPGSAHKQVPLSFLPMRVGAATPEFFSACHFSFEMDFTCGEINRAESC